MPVYVSGTLVPPVDAASLDGVTANFGTPGAPQDGYQVTYESNTDELVLTAPAATPTFSSGTLGAAAASPAAGDQRLCTDYDVTLECVVAGTWRVTGADELGVTLGPMAAGQAYNVSGIVSVDAGTAVGPTLANGTSFAIGFWATIVPATEQILWSQQTAGNGFILGVNAAGPEGYLYLYREGITGPAASTKVIMAQAVAVGGNTLAVDIAADGLSFTWSLNGGASATIVTAGVYVPPAVNAYSILGNYQLAAVPLINASIAWAQAWSTLLGAALATVSGAFARLVPGNPGAATSTYAFLAAKQQAGIQFASPTGSAATPLQYNGLSTKRVQRL